MKKKQTPYVTPEVTPDDRGSTVEVPGTLKRYKDIKDFYERCEEHPDHQTGMISYRMIERRLQEEINELRDFIEMNDIGQEK
jgi:hypothetical protein